MKNDVTLPNDVTSDGYRAESESTRPNVRSRMAEWLRRLTLDQKVRGSIPGSTLCAAVFVVIQTVTYKLLKFIFTVYCPVFRMRR